MANFNNNESIYTKRIVLSVNYVLETLKTSEVILFDYVMDLNDANKRTTPNLVVYNLEGNIYIQKILNRDGETFTIKTGDINIIKSNLITFFYLGFNYQHE